MNNNDKYIKYYMKNDENWEWKKYKKIYWYKYINEI